MNTYKLELNDKLAELYSLDRFTMKSGDDPVFSYQIRLIDDSGRIFDLALENDIWIQPYNSLGFIYAHVRKDVSFDKVFYKDHETPQAAARYALALALVNLAESKP